MLVKICMEILAAPKWAITFVESLYLNVCTLFNSNFFKATITRCDLSPRFFCIDATLLCEFESNKM